MMKNNKAVKEKKTRVGQESARGERMMKLENENERDENS